MNYISNLITKGHEGNVENVESVNRRDQIDREKFEREERKFACKVTKEGKCEISISGGEQSQSVVLDEKESYFLKDFVNYVIPRIAGWEVMTRYYIKNQNYDNRNFQDNHGGNRRNYNDRPPRYDRNLNNRRQPRNENISDISGEENLFSGLGDVDTTGFFGKDKH